METQSELTQTVKDEILAPDLKKGGAGLMHEWTQEWLVTCTQIRVRQLTRFSLELYAFRFPYLVENQVRPFPHHSQTAPDTWERQDSSSTSTETSWRSLPIGWAYVPWPFLGQSLWLGPVTLAHPGLCVHSCVQRGGYLKGKNSGQKG